MVVSQESRFKVKILELQDYFLTILQVIVGMQLTIIYFSMHKLWNYAFTMRQLIRQPIYTLSVTLSQDDMAMYRQNQCTALFSW